MDGIKKLERERLIQTYVNKHSLTDALEAMLAGLVILRPEDPCAWCVQALSTLEDMPPYSITWECLIPLDKRVRKPNIYVSGLMDEIFRLGTMTEIPTQEMFERAYNHLYQKMMKKSFNAILAHKNYKIQKRKNLNEAFDKARTYYKHRYLSKMIESWQDYTKKRLDAHREAEKIIKKVWTEYYEHAIITNWQSTVIEIKTTRKYFEQLESGEGSALDAETLQQFGIDLYRDPVSLLPRKVAIQIFSHLNIVDLTTCGLVCMAWKVLTAAPSLWSHLDFYRVRHRFAKNDKAVIGKFFYQFSSNFLQICTF